MNAGGGYKRKTNYGATDAIGLNQDALSYQHHGRKERLTEVRGTVIKDIVS